MYGTPALQLEPSFIIDPTPCTKTAGLEFQSEDPTSQSLTSFNATVREIQERAALAAFEFDSFLSTQGTALIPVLADKLSAGGAWFSQDRVTGTNAVQPAVSSLKQGTRRPDTEQPRLKGQQFHRDNQYEEGMVLADVPQWGGTSASKRLQKGVSYSELPACLRAQGLGHTQAPETFETLLPQQKQQADLKLDGVERSSKVMDKTELLRVAMHLSRGVFPAPHVGAEPRSPGMYSHGSSRPQAPQDVYGTSDFSKIAKVLIRNSAFKMNLVLFCAHTWLK